MKIHLTRKQFIVFLFILVFFSSHSNCQDSIFVIAVQGGAGNIQQDKFSKVIEDIYRLHLEKAISIGYSVLDEGGSAIEAVEATIVFLENSPLFNAGRGAVKNVNGEYELDASIMDGSNMNAGAVAVVKDIKNPISAARIVMTETRHLLLCGEGASDFVKKHNLELVDTSYYSDATIHETQSYGTVGCVALDKRGNLAAGTSTGGLDKKLPGRIGDSPIIGAGTYANNNCCAISSTGQGEYFMRYVIAYDIAAQMLYTNTTLEESANQVIHNTLTNAGGAGGILGIDKFGNVTMVFNTTAMLRGYKKSTGEQKILIFK